MQVDVRPQDCEKVLAALTRAARLSRTDVSRGVFNRNRTQSELEAIAAVLERTGRIRRMTIPPGNGSDKPTEVWEANSSSMTSDGNSGMAIMDRAPAGDGWVPRASLVRRARRGVMPAHAQRVGQRIRRNEIARRKGTGTGQQIVTDEERGATHLITEAVNTYRKQGIIEIQGGWIRLAQNPKRRPPHHWHEALLQFLAEGHPTLDGKWHRKPTSLTDAMEMALGRRLGPDEQVRRRLGCAGSWHPDDIILINDEAKTVQTLAEIQAQASGRIAKRG